MVKNETTNAVLAQKLDGFKELVDNRFKNVESTLTRIENNSSGYASQFELNEFKKSVETKYITKDQFWPVRMVVYGLVGIILTAVIGAMITLVIIKR